ncbi:MAG: ABC transporter [Sphingomonadales bacterium]|nr:MAG: ABC transporter [Sphingomonadales bacterium]
MRTLMKNPAFLLVLLATPLAGCISFGAKPPASYLTLDPAAAIAVGDGQSSASSPTITIAVPAVPQELATQRVPVHAGGQAIAYVKDAMWVEQPARLFARLLSDTVTSRTGRVVLSGRQSQLDPGAQLSGELRRFGIDETTSEAVVTFDASLMRGTAAVFEKRRFEARVPVAAIETAPVGAALNQAANQVAGQIADWIGR